MATKARNPLKLQRYLQLVREFPLVPIENKRQLSTAIDMIDRLVDRDLNPEEEAYLDVLAHIVERYEDRAYPIAAVDDAALLADILESKGLTQVAFARATGISESTVSSVLKGTRNLTREQIGRIATSYNIPAGVFSFTA